MKNLFRIILIISIVIVSALLVLSLMSFKGGGNLQNLNSFNSKADLEDMSAPKPVKPGDTTTTTAADSGQENTANTEFIFMDAKGTGDYKTLEDAISNAGDGGTIILDSGTYTLSESLEISKPVNLIGKGPDKTIVIGEKGDSVIYFSAEGKFFAEGITFTRKGNIPGEIIYVEDSDVFFNNCVFSGGKPSQDVEQKWGSGLLLCGKSMGTISNCLSESNAFCGISIEDESNFVLINNISRKNAYSGINYYGNSGGYAIKNECYLNGSDGLQVQFNSVPILISNNSHDNKYDGISYYDNAAGLAFQNTCSKNEFGIYVTDKASPLLESNILKNNTEKDFLQE